MFAALFKTSGMLYGEMVIFSGGKCLTVVLTSPYVFNLCQSFDVIRLLMGL